MRKYLALALTGIVFCCGFNDDFGEPLFTDEAQEQELVGEPLIVSNAASRANGVPEIGQVLQQQHTPRSNLEEYVNRVAKRLLLVSSNPANNYAVLIDDEDKHNLYIDALNHTVTISRWILDELNDEAELAATIALLFGMMDSSVELDREAVNLMYRAGYDPTALVELQEQCFYADIDQQQHWLKDLYPQGLTASKIMANKVIIDKMPSGLMRGINNYQEQIRS